MTIDRTEFFNAVRQRPFKRKLTQGQVDGMNRILDEWEKRGLTDVRWLAYILATTKHETAHKMQPIQELDNKAGTYLRSQKYWPWIGRGYVQLTHEFNYIKFRDRVKRLFGVDIVQNPDAAKIPDVAIYIMFEGMINGEYAHPHSLKKYFNETTNDPVGARRIVNGVDDKDEIAEIYDAFYGAIKAAEVAAEFELAPRQPVEPEPAKTLWQRITGWFR